LGKTKHLDEALRRRLCDFFGSRQRFLLTFLSGTEIFYNGDEKAFIESRARAIIDDDFAITIDGP
jgi:hypothetical protein